MDIIERGPSAGFAKEFLQMATTCFRLTEVPNDSEREKGPSPLVMVCRNLPYFQSFHNIFRDCS